MVVGRSETSSPTSGGQAGAEHGDRAGEDHLAHAELARGLEDVQRAVLVDGVGAQRVALAGGAEDRSQVVDDLGAPLGEQGVDLGGVGDVEARPRQAEARLLGGRREIAGEHVVAAGPQSLQEVEADLSAGAGDEDLAARGGVGADWAVRCCHGRTGRAPGAWWQIAARRRKRGGSGNPWQISHVADPPPPLASADRW
jgi:hypothetical protein